MLVSKMKGGGGEFNFDVADAFGRTPLHYAALRGATVCCLLLLRHGADIDAEDADGNTPLALAVLGQHEGCSLALMQNKAKVDVMVHPNYTKPVEKKKEQNKKEKPLHAKALFDFSMKFPGVAQQLEPEPDKDRDNKSYSIFQVDYLY